MSESVGRVGLVTGDAAPIGALPAWSMWGLALGLVVVFAPLLIWLWWSVGLPGRLVGQSAQERAFVRLAAACGLASRERAVVRHLARRARVTPGALLIVPSVFDAAAENRGKKGPPEALIERVRAKVFDRPARPVARVALAIDAGVRSAASWPKRRRDAARG